MRLGVYADLVYRCDERGLSTDRAFVQFVTSLAPQVEELVLFGRLDPEPGRAPYAIGRQVRHVPFPHYRSMRDVPAVVRSVRAARQAFERDLDGLDAVWIFGPHPLAVELVRIAARRGVTVFLGVRQNFPEYVAGRLPSRRWLWALGAAYALERTWRLLARRHRTVVVGEALAHAYRGGAPVLATGFSLVRAAEVAADDEATSRDWDAPQLRLLSVGRLDPEKNPLLLPEILALLRARDPRWQLAVAGDGPLAQQLMARAAELGVDDSLELLGYVPNGPMLRRLYAGAHAFLHVSLTEGLPQVLFEAQAAGLPLVATDVGGVRAAVEHAALLVPPRDAAAASAAVERLRTEPELRRRLTAASLENARAETLEAQLERILAFFGAQTG
jgi:glycosyltransferase involved in cell wall biosynthesis